MDRFIAAATVGLAAIGLVVAGMDAGTHPKKLPAEDMPGLSLIKDASAASGAGTPERQARRTVRAEPPVDINSASEQELEKLPGVGPVRAKRIVRGRPWSSKNDLVDMRVLPQDVYDGIEKHIVARHNNHAGDTATGGG